MRNVSTIIQELRNLKDDPSSLFKGSLEPDDEGREAVVVGNMMTMPVLVISSATSSEGI